MAMIMNGLNAKRFAGKPLRQPKYSFKDIPKCNKDLSESSLQEVSNRDELTDSMAEMVLLCNETMRRLHVERKVGKRTSKPLSLEYIADRLDIDDPMFGYLVRCDTPENKGKLQGFITCTTFTNWQKTFRWDSMHDSAFAYDDEGLAEAMQTGVRRYDEDGSLAEALQKTIRCGDPWNEGIVWPRIAEISLLGAMGCGKALVSLVIEKLERMKASCKQNYDYVVLQATENSIPFYESLGFVRVGGITEDEQYEEKQAKLRGEQVPQEPTSPPQSEIVSSPVDVYVTKEAGETPADVAKKFDCSVWDIIFLNHYVYPHIGTRSKLMKDTSLYVPVLEDSQPQASSQSIAPQWYIAEENDTPRMIARQFNVSCAELVTANRSRLPELQSQSRLKEGTRIKVSHFHVDDDKHVPYCHWTFPDDSFETSEPSYMLVRKLNRIKGTNAAKVKPIESSLAVPVSPYAAPPSELFHEVQLSNTPGASAKKKKAPKSSNKKKQKNAVAPAKPKRPLNPYMLFCAEQREFLKDEIVGLSGPEVSKALSEQWKDLSEAAKKDYRELHEIERSEYKTAMAKYEKELAAFQEAHPELGSQEDDNGNDGTTPTLFNKVVRLNSDGVAQTGSEYEYYFVLTFIPDLCWAHLAPLECVGVYGPEKPKAGGRPIWMLVDESEGKEVDISGSCCVPVRSRAMKRTADADCEQWDILDADDTVPVSARKIRPRVGLSSLSSKKPAKGSTKEDGSVKKKRGRPRKHPLPEPRSEKTPGGKKQGRPPKQQRSATKPLSGSIEPKKRHRGTPKKTPSSDSNVGHPSPLTGFVKPKKGRPRKNPLPEPEVATATAFNVSESVKLRKRGKGGSQGQDALPAVGNGRVRTVGGSDTEEDDGPKRRGRQPRKTSFSATKPLGGSIERKKRKRRTSSRSSVKNPSSRSKDEEGRPAKRRKLPRRDVAPTVGSYQDVESSDVDIDDDQLLPANRTPARRNRQFRATSRSGKQNVQSSGSSPFRTVALTRSAKKLSMTSPLMFSPRRRARARG